MLEGSARSRGLSGDEEHLGLLPRLVARLGLVVRRIEAGQRHAALDLAHHPAFVALVLGAFARDEVYEIFRDQHCAVVVDHDHVIGKHRNPAACDRLLPADEGQPVHRRMRRRALAPHRQIGRDNTRLSRTTPSVTSALTPRRTMRMHRMSPNILPWHAHRIRDRDAASGIASIAPRVEIGCAQLAGVARSSRTGTKRSVNAGPTMRFFVSPKTASRPDPAMADALLEQHRGDSGVVTVSNVAPDRAQDSKDVSEARA